MNESVIEQLEELRKLYELAQDYAEEGDYHRLTSYYWNGIPSRLRELADNMDRRVRAVISDRGY